MNRTIIEACAPWGAALAVLCGLFVVVAWLSGGQWRLIRLRSLHRCESGGVQSLAFVLTLPLLCWILLFIVQVSQLMVALTTVNFAAFASARAASVWIPAAINDQYWGTSYGADLDNQNELPPGIEPSQRLLLSADSVHSFDSRKYDKIWTAAALACAPISPSRPTPDASRGIAQADRASTSMQRLYPQFDPAATTNSVTPRRLDAKLGYSFENTYVLLEFEDRNSLEREGTVTYNPNLDDDYPIPAERLPYYLPEVGWQDPVTVRVHYDLALLPGVGQIVSVVLNREHSASPEDPLIRRESGIYKTRLTASATMTNEGIKSVIPYVHSSTP